MPLAPPEAGQACGPEHLVRQRAQERLLGVFCVCALVHAAGTAGAKACRGSQSSSSSPIIIIMTGTRQPYTASSHGTKASKGPQAQPSTLGKAPRWTPSHALAAYLHEHKSLIILFLIPSTPPFPNQQPSPEPCLKQRDARNSLPHPPPTRTAPRPPPSPTPMARLLLLKAPRPLRLMLLLPLARPLRAKRT